MALATPFYGKADGLSRNIGAFSRFLEIASFSQGESLNITEVYPLKFGYMRLV